MLKKVIEEKASLVFEGCNFVDVKNTNGDGSIIADLIQIDDNGIEVRREIDFIFPSDNNPYELSPVIIIDEPVIIIEENNELNNNIE